MSPRNPTDHQKKDLETFRNPSLDEDGVSEIINAKKTEIDAQSVTSISDRLVDKTPWRSVIIAGGLGFCQAVQFTLYFSSTWPYLQVVDRDSTEEFYGAVIAIYSIGQLISSPLFGYWSTKSRGVKAPLVTCLILSMIGNFTYVLAEILPHNARYLVIFARLIVGIGSGNVSVLKSYVAMASTQQDRGRAFAFLTGGITLGQTTGPVLQLLFTMIGYPGIPMFGRMKFNMYTSAAYSAVAMNFLALFFLLGLFEEKYAGIDKSQLEKKTKEEKSMDQNRLPPFDMIAVFVCYCTIFAQRFTFVNLETLNAPMGQTIFGYTRLRVVQVLGVVHAASTAVALVLYIAFVVFKLDRYMNLRRQVIIAFFGLLIFHFVTYAWPFLPGRPETYSQQEYDLAQDNGTELTGCNSDRFDWCESVPRVDEYLFYITTVIFVGFCQPNINITLNTLFSKILGPRRIGTQQGILQMCGSAARLVGPILASQAYTKYGPQIPWIMSIAVVAFVIAAWLVFHNRMVPLTTGIFKLELTSRSSSSASERSTEAKRRRHREKVVDIAPFFKSVSGDDFWNCIPYHYTQPARAFTELPQSSQCVVGDRAGGVRLLEVDGHAEELDKKHNVHNAEIVDICVNPGASLVASTSNEKYVNLLPLKDNKFGKSDRLKTEQAVRSLVCVEDCRNGANALLCGCKQVILAYDVVTRKCFGTMFNDQSGSTITKLSGVEGCLLLSATADRCNQLWDIRVQRPVKSFDAISKSTLAAGAHVDSSGRVLARIDGNDMLYFHDLDTGKLFHKHQIPDVQGQLTALRFTSLQRYLAMADSENIYLMDWNHPTSAIISKPIGKVLPEDKVSKIRWHSTNKQFYCAGNTGFQTFQFAEQLDNTYQPEKKVMMYKITDSNIEYEKGFLSNATTISPCSSRCSTELEPYILSPYYGQKGLRGSCYPQLVYYIFMASCFVIVMLLFAYCTGFIDFLHYEPPKRQRFY
ncbi:unnamed protein product [Bursaphelenchus xylophilus]|uniref:(pine wood nematode) hypothetical protein n=1 Tax=Bursaphelenchus xylophilus TaxID=6326 RepID=A0A1I7S9V8_BURXY|nr:unnamed protein product [Bursaphelenchus xylophilus]CAG9129273.1 unnamed protein product [Bursaphelenchus xylophilus]